MVGITSYGAYIPIYRLSQAELARAWGGRPGRGEKAIANYDEDSITMAVEAVTDCLNGMDRSLAEGLYFASTTPPYREKQSASIIAAATDLRQDMFTVDFTDSLRAGTSAMKAALDAISAGSAKRVLVAAADCRVPPPDSEFESIFGDGAAAFLLADSDVAVEIEGSYFITSDFIDIWRREQDPYVHTWEDRFVLTHGYQEIAQEAISGLMRKYDLSPKDFTKAIFYAPNARAHATLARALGFDLKAQVQDPMFTTVGNSGTAFAPMMLVAALEEAKPGDRLLLANYGDGCDCYILRVTEGIENIKDRRGIKRHLESKMMLPSYEKYLKFRGLMQWETSPRPSTEASLNITWRDRKAIISGNGHRCKVCGHVQFPPQRVCMWCQAKGEFEYVRIADKKGPLFTFSVDERTVLAPELPNVLSVVNLEGGGRFYGVMTDRDPQKIELGMPMELSFRRMHEGSGFHNYFWKSRPVRC
jgi:3-hydroxy-3-methylglutaryl CoA synthase